MQNFLSSSQGVKKRDGFTPLQISEKNYHSFWPFQVKFWLRRKPSKDKKFVTGFTLVEILVYIAILGIVGSIAANLFIDFLGSYTKIKVKKEILAGSRLALDDIVFEIKHAKSIYTTASSTSQLSLETLLNPPADESATYVDFYIDNGMIMRKKEGQNPESLTSNRIEITNLNFTYLGAAADPSSVKIDIDARYRSNLLKQKYQSEVNISSSASLR